MITFVMQGRYSAEAIKAISAKRTAQAKAIVEECGGKLLSIYATMGDSDLLAIVEFPGVGEAVKASIGLNKTLGICFSTVPALKVDEFDKLIAAKR
ncbi:MAG: GYD domain-containing protein [Candidatus Hydrogenedentes bacterium]|nr:GYD domain-containing protein [Candidatus Hydrogenedentota bacterium]